MEAALELTPTCMVSVEQFVGLRRPPRTSWISRQRTRRMLLGVFEDGIDDRPRHLDLVAPGKERRIADHAVEQQRFVRRVRIVAERFSVPEVHVDRSYLETGRQ